MYILVYVMIDKNDHNREPLATLVDVFKANRFIAPL